MKGRKSKKASVGGVGYLKNGGDKREKSKVEESLAAAEKAGGGCEIFS